MRPRCPACNEPCEDDGDRYYPDTCSECGWRSASREQADQANAEKIRRRKRAAEARAVAQDAFWAVIAEAFPTAKFGDFSPEGTVAFDAACERAVDEWVQNNVPMREQRPGTSVSATKKATREV